MNTVEELLQQSNDMVNDANKLGETVHEVESNGILKTHQKMMLTLLVGIAKELKGIHAELLAQRAYWTDSITDK